MIDNRDSIGRGTIPHQPLPGGKTWSEAERPAHPVQLVPLHTRPTRKPTPTPWYEQPGMITVLIGTVVWLTIVIAIVLR